MKNLLENLRHRIVALRKAMKWTQKELAQKAGLSLRRLQDIEAAKVDVRLTTIEKIANVFVTHPYQLLCHDPNDEFFLKNKAELKNQTEGYQKLENFFITPYSPLDELNQSLKVFDKSGLILFVNAKWCQQFKYARDEVLRKIYVWDVLVHDKEKNDMK